ncbi:MAG TPA: hypothetical protein VHR88_01240 [Solirubrobacteraceae bacterium]|nr:hypothetical protein [Solirubrobacteraceae bacterium]
MTTDLARPPVPPVTLSRPAWLSTTLLIVVGCVALAALSLLEPGSPTYDPWSWLIWGREVAHLDLSTVTGPSWKPLPVLFTTPFSVFGDAAPALWLVVARAGALLGLVMAFRLARRLAGEPWGIAAGLVAVLALVTSTGYIRDVWPGNSEGLLIAFSLWAVESHLEGRHRQAYVLGLLAALLRPESWVFLAAYGLWLAWRRPRTRTLVIGSGVVALLLWFLPELWGSGQIFRAAERANNPDPQSPAYAPDPALQVIRNYGGTFIFPLFALAGLAIGSALARRPRELPLLAVAVLSVIWVAIVAVMTQAGYSGNPRYLMPVGAVFCVLAGVGVARLLELSPTPRSLWLRLGICAVVGVVAYLLVFNQQQLDLVRKNLNIEKQLNDQLKGAVAVAGGTKAVLACGRPVTGAYQVPALAWRLGVHSHVIGLAARSPAVVFRADAPGVLRMPPPPPQPPFRTFGTAGVWQVSGACR